jgi:hypothetical protein
MATTQKATETSASSATTAKDEAVVEYVGTANEAKISAADWRKAGVEAEKLEQVVWNAANRKRVKVSDLSADQLAVLRNDDRFKVPAEG